ncbi:MAG: hypothetical protein RIF32_03655, partial [Leptospirales bacterium]
MSLFRTGRATAPFGFALSLAFLFSVVAPGPLKAQQPTEPAQAGDSSPPGEAATPPATDETGVESRYGKVPVDENGKPIPLSMEGTIRLVLENNNQVRIQQLEILKSD